MIREFRLSPAGSGRGVSCDESGAFVGAVPLLKREIADGAQSWAPRAIEELSEELSSNFGLPIDASSKAAGLRSISRALNKGDLARAQIAAVLLGIPDPPLLSKGAFSRGDLIRFIQDLYLSNLIKADWDPDEHPRWPADAPDSQGGQFSSKDDEESACNRTVTSRRKWMRANNRDWPIDKKSGRPQDVAHIKARADGGSDEADNIKPMPHDEHIQEHKDRGDFSRWAKLKGTKGPAAPKPQIAPSVRPKPNPALAPKAIPRVSPKTSGIPTPKVAPEPEPIPEPMPPLDEPLEPEELIPEELIPLIIPE